MSVLYFKHSLFLLYEFFFFVITVFSTFYSSECVTRWYDSDDPDTNRGNFEFLSTILNKYPGEICRNPIAIEAQTVSGDPVNKKMVLTGFLNDVRFTCPDEWCSTCRTPWFDQDDPDKEGDWETLSSILLKYPLQVCAQPIAIEVVTTSGILVQPNGNFPIYDPTQGFACVNQPLQRWCWWSWWCKDYKVRFTCPRSFCQPSMYIHLIHSYMIFVVVVVLT
uniref:WxxW domain-containing protein n=1 Tax=Cyprinus carpio TaxID=7962 RepID=A0A8C1G2T8_CYPCA